MIDSLTQLLRADIGFYASGRSFIHDEAKIAGASPALVVSKTAQPRYFSVSRDGL